MHYRRNLLSWVLVSCLETCHLLTSGGIAFPSSTSSYGKDYRADDSYKLSPDLNSLSSSIFLDRRFSYSPSLSGRPPHRPPPPPPPPPPGRPPRW